MTFPRLIGFANVTTASLRSETDIYELPDLAFSFSLGRDHPLTSASRKASGTNSFLQSYSKELLRQTAFLKATLRVMTEGFLKPIAKTAFFKAIL